MHKMTYPKFKLFFCFFLMVLLVSAGEFSCEKRNHPCKVEAAINVTANSSDGWSTVADMEDIKITVHPSDVTATENENISFSVKAEGESLRYQWYYKKKGEKTFCKWEGHIADTFTEKGDLSWDGMQVYCEVRDDYESQKTNIATVTIKKIQKETILNIAIKTKPYKQIYTEEESFNAAGMKLKVTYSDGSQKVIDNGFTCTPSGKLTAEGQQKIVVTYGGKATGFYVTVNKAVASVTIKKLPAKKIYNAGESFSASGMIVKVTYRDGTYEEKTDGFTCTPSGKLTAEGQQKIVVTYGGKATGFYVTVK